jgi:hypothetical protein
MPKHVRIPADAETVAISQEALEAQVTAAAEHVEELRLQRVAARELAPAEKQRILAETDQPFTAAIAAVHDAEKALARFLGRGRQPGQHVPLQTVTEGEEVTP